jgi:Lrp/AsnC family transcriptional regulator, leucine-responsive regulatory protein
MELDRFDARILSELQRDGRLPVVELAQAIGLSATPCARRIKALESAGVIEGYTALLSPSRVGLEVQAIVHVKLTEHTDESVARFEREIALLEEVTHCYAMTGRCSARISTRSAPSYSRNCCASRTCAMCSRASCSPPSSARRAFP